MQEHSDSPPHGFDPVTAAEVQICNSCACSIHARNAYISDLVTAAEIQIRDGGASSSQTGQTCVSDLVTAAEIQIRDGGASSSQTGQTCVSDLVTAEEDQSRLHQDSDEYPVRKCPEKSANSMPSFRNCRKIGGWLACHYISKVESL